MSASITILHLSDLHYDHKRPLDRQFVLDALLSDIKALRSTGRAFDLVIFTGDLVQAGAESASFSEAQSAFLEPALHAAGLGMDRLVIVPGNHDIDAREAALAGAQEV